MSNRSFIYKMSQRTDVSLRQKRDASFLCRYAAVLSPEAKASGARCEDYLTFAAGGGAVQFAVCDGVGMSYRGDAAARLLGDSLLAWLEAADITKEADPARLADGLTEYLNRLTKEASLRVMRSRIPSDAPEMLKEVLQEKKRQGSEAMFVCGRWEANGLAAVFGMGDIRLRGWSDAGELPRLLPLAARQRWSALHGLAGGALQWWVGDATKLDELVVYTDGLASLDAEALPLHEASIQEHLHAARSRSGGDDAALLILERQVGTWRTRS